MRLGLQSSLRSSDSNSRRVSRFTHHGTTGQRFMRTSRRRCFRGVRAVTEIEALVTRIVDRRTKVLLKALGQALGRYGREAVEPLAQRLTQIEKRGLPYRGVFQKAENYNR